MDNLIDKMEQMKGLKNGRGIPYLLNAAYEIMGNPILMHDMEYRLLALTQNVTLDDPIWNEYITFGTVSDKTKEFFKNERFIDAAANAKTIAFLTSNKLKYDRILGKIFNKNKVIVACAIVVACNKPFTREDPVIFEQFCEALSKEISKNEFYQQYGERYQENLISKLIDGNIENKGFYTNPVANIYADLKENIYLAVVDTALCDSERTRLIYFKNLLNQQQPAHKYFIYSHYIIILISTDSMIFDVKNALNDLNHFFFKSNIYVGISSCFDNLFELHKYYAQALHALRCGIEISSQRIFTYDNIKL